jgi:predicted MPP superfamily phosphohydrolase
VSRSVWTRGLVALVFTGVAALAWATLWERHWFALRHAAVPALGPTPGMLRVLHLSDLHLLPGQDRKLAFVRSCLAASPDLVVLTGDVLGHPDVIDDAAAALTLPDGVPGLLVLGSNDFFGPTLKNPLRYFAGPSQVHRGRRLDTCALVRALRAAGWTLMDNRREQVATAAGTVDVAGLGDPHMRRDRASTVDWTRPDAAMALRLGLVHAPYLRALDRFDRSGFDIVLAGHTHGGQVRVPWIGPLVVNCDLPLSQARGLSRHGVGLWLHVSAGLGHSQFAPLRFACRPEATLLDVVPGA